MCWAPGLFKVLAARKHDKLPNPPSCMREAVAKSEKSQKVSPSQVNLRQSRKFTSQPENWSENWILPGALRCARRTYPQPDESSINSQLSIIIVESCALAQTSSVWLGWRWKLPNFASSVARFNELVIRSNCQSVEQSGGGEKINISWCERTVCFSPLKKCTCHGVSRGNEKRLLWPHNKLCFHTPFCSEGGQRLSNVDFKLDRLTSVPWIIAAAMPFALWS